MFGRMLSFGLVSLSSSEGVAWWDYPGFELWRFVNLLVFIGVGLYLHHRFGRPISEGLRTRRERIKLELQKAHAERDEALARLADVEMRLRDLDSQVAHIRAQAEAEAVAERERIRRSTELEMQKLRDQGQKEIANAAKSAQLELRRFAAAQSIRLAETLIRRDIRAEDDARLIDITVEQLGGNRS